MNISFYTINITHSFTSLNIILFIRFTFSFIIRRITLTFEIFSEHNGGNTCTDVVQNEQPQHQNALRLHSDKHVYAQENLKIDLRIEILKTSMLRVMERIRSCVQLIIFLITRVRKQ